MWKQYVVFVGSVYYPRGGALDFHSSHETLSAAIDAARERFSSGDYGMAWYQIVDIITGEIIDEKSE